MKKITLLITAVVALISCSHNSLGINGKWVSDDSLNYALITDDSLTLSCDTEYFTYKSTLVEGNTLLITNPMGEKEAIEILHHNGDTLVLGFPCNGEIATFYRLK